MQTHVGINMEEQQLSDYEPASVLKELPTSYLDFVRSSVNRCFEMVRAHPWVSVFIATVSLRFLSVIPFVVDDDEAWWVAAARALKTPWEYYFRAVDHKTPGVVWFYWVFDRIADTGSDPRITRAIYTVLLALAGGLLGWLGGVFQSQKNLRNENSTESRRSVLIIATFFMIGTLAACPKLFSLTADGVMTLFVIAGYAVAFGVEFPGQSIVAGALLVGGVLVKQTGVFFALPILFAHYPRRFSAKQISGFLLGALLVSIPVIWALDFTEFFYWNWTYPLKVLLPVRTRLFDGNFQLFLSLLWMAFALFPLFIWAFRPQKGRPSDFWWRDARALWLWAGVIVMLTGKGLFLHYFVGLMPPLAILASEGMTSSTPERRRFGYKWLAGGYLICCVIILFAPAAIIWGSDLPYFEKVGKILKETVPSNEKIMVWGGSALPLAYSGLDYTSAYVTPRFATYPYGSSRTQAVFHRDLQAHSPYAIVDLSERGDNQFDNPLSSDPVVDKMIHSQYHPYIVPGLPWAKFYLRFAPPPGSELIPLPTSEAVQEAYTHFPTQLESWRNFSGKLSLETPQNLLAIDQNTRARQSLDLIAAQSENSTLKTTARNLGHMLSLDKTRAPDSQTIRFISTYSPLPWESVMWWPELIFVEVQPRAFQSGKPISM